MKLYHKNPRQITGKQYGDLEKWLLEFGDLSGIVHDLNSDEIVSGNQRGRVFDINECEIVTVQEFDEPDAQGTVALGYVLWQGNRYGYRAVRWTERQCEQANVVANRAGGEWDFDILANEFEVDDLLEWGFKEWELGLGNENDIDAEWKGMPEFEQEDLLGVKTMKVHFATLADVAAFSDLVNQPITEKTKYIWYPEQERQSAGEMVFIDES